ncbi:S8 family serine peptidase [Kribbella sp. NPDC020789]
MRRTRRTLSVAIAAAVGLTCLGRAASADQSDGSAGGRPVGARAAEPEIAGTVTLVTGDKVIVEPGAEPRIERTAGRDAVPVRVRRSGGHLQVIPMDASAGIANGSLDPRLFDVTTLLESGYGDDKRATLPLILQQEGTSIRSLPSGVALGRRLAAVGATTAELAKNAAAASWKARLANGRQLRSTGITKVWLDGVRRPVLDRSARQIGAPTAWERGITGKGVTVAVLDSGVDTTHPDLTDAVTIGRSFLGGEPKDNFGHGTHVASIVTGAGPKYIGIAPDAKLLNGKVCDDEGRCPESAMLAGMEWAAAEQHAKVINLSIGGPDGPEVDPLEQAVNDLTKRYDALFVIAAGNSGGAGDKSVESPGSADAALTVGAVTREDAVTDFSSRGPRAGDSAMKPDIAAPGDGIVAAQAAGTELGEPVEDGYVRLSGTSMATPHVAGAAALLRQEHPEWNAEQVKAVLMGSAKVGADGAFATGAGRLDVAAAIDATVVARPASVSFGLAKWPHDNGQTLEQAVSYHNSGDRPITLKLQLQTPDGQVTPFRLSAAELTVPAGGEAQVNVLADVNAQSLPAGLYAGRLIATGDGAQVSTPVGVEKEGERYAVAIKMTGRDGKAPDDAVTFLDRLGPCDDPQSCSPYLVGGTSAELRVAPGDYAVGHFSLTGTATTVLFEPTFRVAADQSLTLDARTAGAVQMSVPKATARLVLSSVAIGRGMQRPGEALTYLAPGDAGAPIFVGPVGHATAPADELVTMIQGRFAEPGPAGDFADTPYEYNLGRAFPGRIPNGVELRPRAGEFAKVSAGYGSDGPAGEFREAVTAHSASPDRGRELLSIPPALVDVKSSRIPFERTEYYYGNGLGWFHSFYQQGAPYPRGQAEYFTAAPVHYRAGRTYRAGWQYGVLGPRLATGPIFANGATRGAQRRENTLYFSLSLRADSDPGHLTDPRLPFGSMRLTRNGEVIYDQQRAPFVKVDVPAEPADYVLHSRATIPDAAVSTVVDTTWSFRSGHVDGTAGLPLMVARFTPRLDNHNAARPGRFVVPVTVQRQPGADPAEVRSLVVEYSADAGKSWTPAPVTRSSSGWLAHVRNPGSGSVSLRSTAVDSQGGKVEQVIENAYLVR